MTDFTSQLFDETTFYKAFINDLNYTTTEVIIESPYITAKRMTKLSTVIQNLVDRGVNVYIITRDPKEHSYQMADEAEEEIKRFEALGVHVLLCVGNDHRKLAIIDRNILWEGSLNILSQSESREIMRRINDKIQAKMCFEFLHLGNYIY